MTVKRLRPEPAERPKIQCSAPFHKEKWSKDYVARRHKKKTEIGQDPDKCGNWASHVIGGRPFCRSHAGGIALEILEEQNA